MTSQALDPRIYCSLASLLKQETYSRQFVLGSHFKPAGILAGRHRSRLRGMGLNFEELRAYQRGDSLRQIDARTSARMGKPYVRVYSQETDREIYIAVDQRRGMLFGSQQYTKSLIAAELASLLAWNFQQQGDRVGSLMVSDQQPTLYKAERGRKPILRWLQQLTAVNQALNIKHDHANQDDWQTLLEPLSASFNSHKLLALVTHLDAISSDDVRYLQQLSQRTSIMLFLISDPLERDLSQAEGLTVSQNRLQLNIPQQQGVHKKFAQLYDEKLHDVQQALSQCEFVTAQLDTLTPAYQQCLTLLGGGSIA